MAGRELGWYWTRKTATAAWRPAAYHGLSPTGRQTWESGRFVLDESAFAEIGPRILPPDLAAIGSGAGDDIQTARLPFDVQIGSTGFRKGVHLSTLISAAQRWYDLYSASQPPINEEAAAELRSMMGLPEGSSTQGRDAVDDDTLVIAMDEAICKCLNDDRAWMLDDSKPTPGRMALAAYRALASPEKVTAETTRAAEPDEPRSDRPEHDAAIRAEVESDLLADVFMDENVKTRAVAKAMIRFWKRLAAEAKAEGERAERERAAALARHYAQNYPRGSDGRNTFEIYADTLLAANRPSPTGRDQE